MSKTHKNGLNARFEFFHVLNFVVSKNDTSRIIGEKRPGPQKFGP